MEWAFSRGPMYTRAQQNDKSSIPFALTPPNSDFPGWEHGRVVVVKEERFQKSRLNGSMHFHSKMKANFHLPLRADQDSSPTISINQNLVFET